MRTFKLICAAALVLAFTAFATATASAEEVHLWHWLPGTVGTHLSGSSGKATLQVKGGASIQCKKTELSSKEGELLEEESEGGKMATLSLFIIKFSGCTTGGLGINSLGDASGIILVHVHAHNYYCAGGVPCVLITPLPVHLEVPSAKLLLIVEGQFVAKVEAVGTLPTKTYNLIVNQTAGVQEIEKYEGGPAETLLTSIDAGVLTQTAVEVKELTLEFTTEAQQPTL